MVGRPKTYFYHMLNVAVPLYALAQYLQLDALFKDIASRMLLFNQKDANDTQRQCESSMADTRLTRLRTFPMDNFIKLAKAAYNIPDFGPNSVRETSIRTPFRDYFAFNRFTVLADEEVLTAIRDEIPSLLADIILDAAKYGVTAGVPASPPLGQCGRCKRDPLVWDAAKNEAGTNFWMDDKFCYECTVLPSGYDGDKLFSNSNAAGYEPL